MASIKQMKMLAIRCKQAGMEYDFDSFKELENGDVDKKLEEIAKFARDGQTVGSKIAVKQSEFNGQRLGMIQKLIIQSHNLSWCLMNQAEFKKEVNDLYQLVCDTEEAVKSASSSSYSPYLPILLACSSNGLSL